jgi:CubicO group peptidase (beta-lactamase class C family)
MWFSIPGVSKRFAFGLSLAVSFALSTRAAETPESSKKADALFSGLVKPEDPGLAVLVAQNGKILFEKAYGMADREHSVAVDTKNRFRIGSVTKQFTAAAILKLQEDGKLSVNDQLSKYFPDFPRGSNVTVLQLLTHTSGIHNYTDHFNFTLAGTNVITTEALINSFKFEPYDFDPGEKWLYDNSGYVLLGSIVEKVSGESFGAFLQKSFFQPLGMADTGRNESAYPLAHEALGYSYDNGHFNPAVRLDPSWTFGAGDLYSTVEDLNRWTEAIFKGQVLKQATLKSAFTPVRTSENQDDDSGDGYGYGWFISNWRGLHEISHGGNLPGFSSFLSRLPDQKFTIVILANSAPGAHRVVPDTLGHDLVEIYLPDKLAPLPVANDKVPAKAFGALAGRYEFRGQILTVTADSAHLFGQFEGEPKLELFPTSETEFFWKEVYARVKFVKNTSGKAVRAIFRKNGETLYMKRLDSPVPRSLEPAVNQGAK